MILHSGIRDDGNNFQIVPSTRKIVVPPSHKVIGTVGSHNSEQTTFQCPRTIDGHDVASCSDHFICWINANGVYGRYDIENISVDDEYMYLTWVIDSGVTASAGNVSFAVHFEDKDADNKLLYSWGTAECTECEILSTIKGASGTSNNGSIVVGGTLDISKNGVYDVSNYAYVNVSVAGGDTGSDNGEVKMFNIVTNLVNVTADSSNITEIASDKGAMLKFTPNNGYTLPTDIIVNGCQYWWRNFNTYGELVIGANTVVTDVTITIVGVKGDASGDSGNTNPNERTITYALTNVTVENEITSIPAEDFNNVITLKFTANSGYELPVAINVWGCDYEWTKSTGTLLIYDFTDNVRIKIDGSYIAPDPTYDSYVVSTSLSNVTADASNPAIVYNDDAIYEFRFEADDGYLMPSSIDITNVADHTWLHYSESTVGKLRFKGSNVSGNVRITISGDEVKEPTTYKITTSLTNVTANSSNKTSVSSDGGAILYFTANNGYKLPSTITTTNCTCIWNEVTGQLTITSVRGNIKITIVGEKVNTPSEPSSWGTFAFGDNELRSESFHDDADGEPYIRYNGQIYYEIWLDGFGDGDQELYITDVNEDYCYLHNGTDGWYENPTVLEFLVEPSDTVKDFIDTYKNA